MKTNINVYILQLGNHEDKVTGSSTESHLCFQEDLSILYFLKGMKIDVPGVKLTSIDRSWLHALFTLLSLFQPVKLIRHVQLLYVHSRRVYAFCMDHLHLSACYTIMLYLFVAGRHEHLHLACVLLVGRDLAGCLAYGGFVSYPVYYATPYLLH